MREEESVTINSVRDVQRLMKSPKVTRLKTKQQQQQRLIFRKFVRPC